MNANNIVIILFIHDALCFEAVNMKNRGSAPRFLHACGKWEVVHGFCVEINGWDTKPVPASRAKPL